MHNVGQGRLVMPVLAFVQGRFFDCAHCKISVFGVKNSSGRQI